MPYLYAVIERNGVLAGVVGDPPGSLWDHEAVVEAVMQDGAVLPMRCGSVVDDVEAFLASRRASLVAALSRVRGAVELGVRPAADDRDAPSSGTEYLMRRVAFDRVHVPLSSLARASARRVHGFAYLVDAGAVDAFRSRVAALDPRLVCTGPWPPYSFVEDA